MLARRPTQGRQQLLTSVTIPAPTGGMNSTAPASELPVTDCPLLYNMVGSEYGLRSRYGYREWALGLDGPALTPVPFSGAQASGASDKLFYTTATGLWDVSASTTHASRVVSFPGVGGLSGYGISTVVANQAGHFLLYCDEVNGLYVYSGASASWTKAVAGVTQTWAVQTFYTVGNQVVNAGNVYQVTTPGTSSNTSIGPSGNGVFPAWTASTNLVLGAGIVANGNLYIVTTAGLTTSTGTGPTGTGTGLHDSGLASWAISTAYTLGKQVLNGGNLYTCTTAGTSASSGSGPSGTGSSITDGTAVWAYAGVAAVYAYDYAYTAGYIPDGSVIWQYVSVAPTGTIVGPSLADQQNGLTLDPGKLVFAMVWKSRVFYVERDTARAWYGPVNAFQGTLTSFNFGIRFQHGGPIAGLYSWAYDSGGGMDTRLVGISTGGDIVIYGGTDPNSASTFGLFGCWYQPGVPAGRRIATDFGGDLLVNSTLGTTALSKLVLINNPSDQAEYFTGKISNTFALLANSYRTLPGWGISVHPEDNALLVLIPTGAGGTSTMQLAYCFTTQSWGYYRDLPMVSCGVWNGVLYFGTPDGRVCQHTGYVDNVSLANPNSYVPVNWSLVTRFQNGGNANQKRVVQLTPSILSESPDPSYNAEARFNYDLSEASLPSSVYVGSDYLIWDVGKWDQADWAGDYTAAQPTGGALGFGRDVAVAIRGQADSRTILVDIKVLFEMGGLM